MKLRRWSGRPSLEDSKAMPQDRFRPRLPPNVLDQWSAKDEILKRARKLRWIGHGDEADKLVRTLWQGDDVRPPPPNKASE
jgi:hypothetical protein